MITLSVDGVLRQPVSGAPIPSGTLLYRALTEITNVALIADEQTEEQVKHWLLVNDLTEHNYLVMAKETDPEDPGERRVQQVTRLAATAAVDLAIEADPARAEALIRDGVATLLYMHPAYSRPDYLPGSQRLPTPWSSLVAETERQQTIKANDARLSHETI